MWLDPHCEQLMQLQAALVAAFPDCTDLSNDPSWDIRSFAPHLSLGQWRSPGDVKQAQQAGLLYALPLHHQQAFGSYIVGHDQSLFK